MLLCRCLSADNTSAASMRFPSTVNNLGMQDHNSSVLSSELYIWYWGYIAPLPNTVMAFIHDYQLPFPLINIQSL